MVGTVVPHQTVADLIAPMAQEALDLIGRARDAEPSIQVGFAPAKRRRTDECLREASAGPLLQPPPRPPAIRHYENTLLAVHHHGNTSPAAGGQTGETKEMDEYVGAHIRGLFELISPYMANAIKCYEDNGTLKAGVRMVFPGRDLDLPCTITFEILDQKVEFLAWKLYNSHLERDGAVWVLYYNEDARTAEIGHGSTFLTCATEAIPSLFGRLLTAGNVASPHRQRDRLDDMTKTVTMKLPGGVGQGALITMSLGSIEGSQVFEKLYAK